MPVCPACLAEIAPLSAPGCRQCGKNWREAEDSADGRCLSCLANPPAYSGTVCASAYEGAARELIHLLKFGGVTSAAEFWATRLAECSGQLPEAPEVIVPVPLGRRRQRQRGFNQSGEIARRLARKLGCAHVPRGLQRRRETVPQSGLDLAHREKNLHRAFIGNRRRLAGRSVLLVDDVLTTGATARAAAEALRSAGARRVMLAVAARADLRLEGAAA